MSYNSKYTGRQVEHAIEELIDGNPMFFHEHYVHGNNYRKGSLVRFSGGIYIAKKDTSSPPIPLVYLENGVIAMTDLRNYVTAGSYEEIGNKDDWGKMQYDELRLSSRKGTLDGSVVDIRDLSGDDVYRFKPYLKIDMIEGTINDMYFDDIVRLLNKCVVV